MNVKFSVKFLSLEFMRLIVKLLV